MKNDGDWVGVIGNGERWMDPGYILEEQPTKQFDELHMGCEKKR